MSRPEMITEPCTFHGEGPIWDQAAGALRWVDMLAGDLLSLDSGTGAVRRRHVADVLAAIRPRRGGGLVAAVERGFALLDDVEQGQPRVVAEVWTDPELRMNDGGCDPQGRFYCGSMAYDESPGRGTLYRLELDGSVHPVLEGVTISNGLGWGPDGDLVYYIDTPTQRIDAFDFDAAAGTFANRRPVVTIPEERGAPDGMAVDVEGGLWVALWGGAAVHRYSPEGGLDAVLTLPARRVTACTFGGPDLRDLYITTSRMDVPDGEQPEAGALFWAEVGIRGLPTLTFAG